MRNFILTILGLILATALHGQTINKTVQGDSLLKRISSAPSNDTVAVPEIAQPILYGQSLIYKLRLDSIQKTVPLSYNEYVQTYIDIYVKRKSMYADMLGMSNYYFPIFEKALKAHNIPTELKYLPIVESSMNPHAISRVGATGMWQFMFGTAKDYGLNMDNFVDERKDPIQASYAAAAYFRDAYNELGDWLLAIAAYNCGKGNVTRAMQKAGSRDFWQIRNYLPKETRNYVPAFIAAVYVMKYAKTHQIVPNTAKFSFQTDTVHVKNFVALADVAKSVNHTEETLIALNPSYKKKIVNGTAVAPKRIVIPTPEHQYFEQLFDVLNNDVETDMVVTLATTDDARDLRKSKKAIVRRQEVNNEVIIHNVLPKQTLTAIANKYQVEVQDLKVWNKLVGTHIIPGQKLKILVGKKAKAIEKNIVAVVEYKVKQGDTLTSIAQKFVGATVAGIQKINGLNDYNIQPGMILKIDG